MNTSATTDMANSLRKRKNICIDVDAEEKLCKRDYLSQPIASKSHLPMGSQEPTLGSTDFIPTVSIDPLLASSPCTMPWQGDLWSVNACMPSPLTSAINTPLPVRFPSSLLENELVDEGTEGAVQWVLGLAIHSYVQSDRPEMMYVVLLESGREVHLPCGQVDCISIVNDDSTDVYSTHDEDSIYQFGGGHPSSEDEHEDTQSSGGSLFSSLLRSSAAACSSGADEFSNSQRPSDAVDSYMKAVGTPSDFPFPSQPLISAYGTQQLHPTFQCESAVRHALEIENATISIAPSESMPYHRSYSSLFRDVSRDCAPLLPRHEVPKKTLTAQHVHVGPSQQPWRGSRGVYSPSTSNFTASCTPDGQVPAQVNIPPASEPMTPVGPESVRNDFLVNTAAPATHQASCSIRRGAKLPRPPAVVIEGGVPPLQRNDND